MRPQQYAVKLTPEERSRLETFIATGHAAASELTHARILLKADQGTSGGGWTDPAISQALDIGLSTVGRVRRRYSEAGLEAALKRASTTRVYARKLDGVQEAHLIALACSPLPEGQAQWSLRLLAEKMVDLNYVETVSHETVRQVLEKTNLSHG